MTATEGQCRLYLTVPIGTDAAVSLDTALSAGDVACVLLSGTDTAPGNASEIARHAHANGIAVLVEDDIASAKAIGADGVHIASDRERFEEARDALGDDAIIGVDCGRSKHDAMWFAERGAAYVAFGPGEDQAAMIAWWAELFEVPCVAWQIDDRTRGLELAARGADFLALTPEAWMPAGPGADTAVKDWNDALAHVKSAA